MSSTIEKVTSEPDLEANNEVNIGQIMDVLNDQSSNVELADSSFQLVQTMVITIPTSSFVATPASWISGGYFATGSKTVAHGLGYAPMVVGYYQTINYAGLPVPYAKLPHYGGNGKFGTQCYFTVDSTNITYTCVMPDQFPTGVFGGYFFIYKQPLTGVSVIS